MGMAGVTSGTVAETPVSQNGHALSTETMVDPFTWRRKAVVRRRSNCDAVRSGMAEWGVRVATNERVNPSASCSLSCNLAHFQRDRAIANVRFTFYAAFRRIPRASIQSIYRC